VQELLEILVGNLTVLNRLKEAKRGSKRFVVKFFSQTAPSWRNEETKRHIFVAFFPELAQTQWMHIAAHKETQCLSCSASYCSTHLLYKYCTVCNWTVLTVITQKLLLHVQPHKRTERVQLLSSAMQCGVLFDIVCVYRQSYPEIRLFKEIRMIKNALPHPHNATQHSPKFQSGDCKAALVPIQECGVIRHVVGCKQFNTHIQHCATAEAPFSAIYRPVHTATEPRHLQ